VSYIKNPNLLDHIVTTLLPLQSDSKGDVAVLRWELVTGMWDSPPSVGQSQLQVSKFAIPDCRRHLNRAMGFSEVLRNYHT
jgi:hypothetical protein